MPRNAQTCLKCGAVSSSIHPGIKRVLEARNQFSRLTSYEIHDDQFLGYGDSKASGMPLILLGAVFIGLGFKMNPNLLYVGGGFAALGFLSLIMDMISGARKHFTIQFLEDGNFRWTSNDDEHWYEVRCFLWPNLRPRYYKVSGKPRKTGTFTGVPDRLFGPRMKRFAKIVSFAMTAIGLHHAFSDSLQILSVLQSVPALQKFPGLKAKPREIETSDVARRINKAMAASTARVSLEEIQALRTSGAEIDFRGKRGETVLHRSVEAGNPELIRALIRAGANVNAQDFAGKTALHLAAARGDLETQVELLEAGADPELRDHEGRTTMEAADLSQHSSLALLLTLPSSQKGEDAPAAQTISRSDGRVDLAEYLLPRQESRVLASADTQSSSRVLEIESRQSAPGRWVIQTSFPEESIFGRQFNVYQVESELICRVESADRSPWECHRRYARVGDPIDGMGVVLDKRAFHESAWGLIPSCLEIQGTTRLILCKDYGKVEETRLDPLGRVIESWKLVARFSKRQPRAASRFAQVREREAAFCQEGDASNCHRLGLAEELEGRAAKAADSYRRACELRNTFSCTALGQLELVSAHLPESRRSFDYACRQGDQAGCVSLAKSEAASMNFAEARVPLANACRLSLFTACRILGEMEMKLGNDEAAIAAFQPACLVGKPESCELKAAVQARIEQRFQPLAASTPVSDPPVASAPAVASVPAQAQAASAAPAQAPAVEPAPPPAALAAVVPPPAAVPAPAPAAASAPAVVAETLPAEPQSKFVAAFEGIARALGIDPKDLPSLGGAPGGSGDSNEGASAFIQGATKALKEMTSQMQGKGQANSQESVQKVTETLKDAEAASRAREEAADQVGEDERRPAGSK